MTQKQNSEACHKLFINDKTKITISGVKNVYEFDEGTITAELNDATTLSIDGKGLNIIVLDLEKGSLEIESEDVFGVYYSNRVQAKKGFFSRLVRN